MARPIRFTKEIFEQAYKASSSMFELAQRLGSSSNTPYRLCKLYELTPLGGTSYESSFRMNNKDKPAIVGITPLAQRYVLQQSVEGPSAPYKAQLINKDPARFFQLIELMKLFTESRRLVDVAAEAIHLDPPLIKSHTYLWSVVVRNLGATWDYYQQFCLDLNIIFEPTDDGPPLLPPPETMHELKLYNCFPSSEISTEFNSQPGPDPATTEGQDLADRYTDYVDSYIHLWQSPHTLANLVRISLERVEKWQEKVTQYVDHGPDSLDPFTPANAGGVSNVEEEPEPQPQ